MLRELQRDLAQAFREAGVENASARRALEQLVPMGGVPPERSLGLYQRSLRSAVAQALGEIFPVCAQLVGDDCFRVLARHHMARHASRHPDLARIGDTFPALLPELDFLDTVPYLADVARIELALHHASHAPEPIQIDDPDGIATALGDRPDAWRLVLSPSATLLESRHPARRIWRVHQPGEDGEDRFDIAPLAAPERTIVWRSRAGLRVDEVEDGLFRVAHTIAAGEPVSRLLEVSDTDSALSAIASLFERGWVVGVKPVA